MVQIIEHAPRRPTAPVPDTAAPTGLRNFYLLRFAVAALWVAAAFGVEDATIGALLWVAYPAWDALANGIDAARSGGLARNRPQAINVAVSALTALALTVALPHPALMLAIFGAWALLAGLLQLATGVARWKTFGGQWAMVLSGGQSALAGGLFLYRAQQLASPGVQDVAPYAAIGALYFLVSAVWLTVRTARPR